MEKFEWTWLLWLLLLLALAVIAFSLNVYLFKRKSAKRRNQLQKKIAIQNPHNDNSNRSHDFRTRFNIRITKYTNLKDKESSPEEFFNYIKQVKHYSFDVSELWPDTTLKKIHLTENLYQTVNIFFDQHIQKNPEQLLDKEVGGFLLGRFTRKSPSEPYEVSVDNFVSIGSEEDHHLHLKFSSKEITNRLGDAQDEFPELVVVGWFHTHPGHGLFLSKADLTIQRGFFNEDFQFAMEIDSLSLEQDLGFFTHKSNGDINNAPPSSSWFSWSKLKSEL